MNIYPLGRVMQTLEDSLGLEVTHTYEDLVFVENSAILFQFHPDDPAKVRCFFNTECDSGSTDELLKRLHWGAQKNKIEIERAGGFELRPKEGKEEFEVVFYPEEAKALKS
jgi:hypothetical protein